MSEVAYYTRNEDLEGHLARINQAEFWAQLNPHLHISDNPFATAKVELRPEPTDIERAVKQVALDGYLQTSPVIPIEICKSLCAAIEKIIAAGYHPNYISFYDEYWQVVRGVAKMLEPVLGPGCFPLGDYWNWCVGPSSQGSSSGWGPHRDYQFANNTLREDGRPQLMTCWLPFSDATTLNGCMYVLPMGLDPEIPNPVDSFPLDRLQSIRALPAKAGSVLAWNQYIYHWGSRSSPFAAGPRISTGIYMQSADTSPFVDKVVDFEKPLPFDRRVGFVGSNMVNYHQFFDYPEPVLKMALSHVKNLPNYEELVPHALREML